VIPNLLGGLDANALVINDLDPTIWAYRILDPFVAAVAVDSISRLVGFAAIYALVYFFVRGTPLATWSATAAGLFFAFLPVLPNLAPSISFTAVASLAILNLITNRYRVISWALLVLSTQIIGFVGGGFALLGLLIVITLLAWHSNWGQVNPFVAAVAIDSISRLAGFAAIFALVYFFVRGTSLATWSTTAAGLFFAFLPVLPDLAPSISFTAVASLAILNLITNRYRVISWVLLVLSTQIIGFVVSGFALLAWRRRCHARWRLLAATLAAFIGFGSV